MNDIVIDTNVFAHSSNPESGYFICASTLLEKIVTGDFELAVDEFFFAEEASNTSGIYSEYLEHLNGCELAKSVLSTLIDEGRIKSLSTKVSNGIRGFINQGVPDATDRKFVRVAVNSNNRVLVSNDLRDFHKKFRKESKKKLKIYLLTSTEVLGVL